MKFNPQAPLTAHQRKVLAVFPHSAAYLSIPVIAEAAGVTPQGCGVTLKSIERKGLLESALSHGRVIYRRTKRGREV